MTQSTTLIIPGYQGSENTHWQTWMEARLPNAKRVEQDWVQPILAKWAANIRNAIDDAKNPVWLVAHSFGCLASVLAAESRADKVAGLMLVAPADPERFSLLGVRPQNTWSHTESVRSYLPCCELAVPSFIIASDDDPWMQIYKVQLWGECWGSRIEILPSAGHINSASGFGPWANGLWWFEQFKKSYDDLPLGDLNNAPPFKNTKGRAGYLAKARHVTRQHLGLV